MTIELDPQHPTYHFDEGADKQPSETDRDRGWDQASIRPLLSQT